MPDGFTFDFSEVNQLAASLDEVAHSAGRFVSAALAESSLNIKNDWKSRAKGMKGLKQYPSAIGYDSVGLQAFGTTQLKSTIGPAKRGQGNLGPIIEYGSTTFSPRGFGNAALAAEQDNFQKLLERALQNAEQALTLMGSVSTLIRGV